MRYSGLYDEISEARRADEDVEQGDWKVALKIADFRKVHGLALKNMFRLYVQFLGDSGLLGKTTIGIDGSK